MNPGVVYGCLVPHPPVLIPSIGGARSEEVRKTREAVSAVAHEIARIAPDAMVVISPHAPVHPDAVSAVDRDYVGGFRDFGVDSIRLSWARDLSLLDALSEECHASGVELARCRPPAASFELDHGASVPLYYLQEAGVHCGVLLLAPSLRGAPQHYLFGQLIARSAKRSGKRVVIVASGDMSHRLTPGAPAGFDARGSRYDCLVISALERSDRDSILSIDDQLREAAGECGYRSLVTALGSIDAFESHVLSYEGPFGVGYLVARIIPSRGEGCAAPAASGVPGRARLTREEREVLRLARTAVESHVRYGRRTALPEAVDGLLAREAGVFVCLKLDGQLRGCVGTYQPAEPCVAAEVVRSAISAAVDDPRFPGVTVDELPRLRYSVDILGSPEPVEDSRQLDPSRYGIILRSGERRSLLLPDLPGVETVEEQLEIARKKAGIPSGTRVEISRFVVHRIEEVEPADSGP